jgi:lipopolysaccharide transport system permease protein
MHQFSIAPQDAVIGMWRDRRLILTLVKRDVLVRYRGSIMGILWSFFNPLLMLAIYTFFFSVVFKARWRPGNESRTEFALVLFAGLLVFNLFSECVNRAPGTVLTNVGYVKRVVFPLEILPLVTLGSALFHAGISTAVWLLFYMAVHGIPPATALLFPIVLLPFLLLLMGLSWLLASLGVYLRDVSHVIGIVTAALMFLSPLFYPISNLPQEFQAVWHLNPLASMIEQTRDVLIWGNGPGMGTLAWHTATAAFVAWAGYAWFQKTRKGFADVL